MPRNRAVPPQKKGRVRRQLDLTQNAEIANATLFRRIPRHVILTLDLPATSGTVDEPQMTKNIVHISDVEAANDFASLLERVRDGAEIIIEHEARPVATVRSAEPYPGRLLSESIALAKAHGSTVTLDGDFGADLEAVVNSHREPLNPPAWD
jgi:prevent-host-death family protein